MLQQARWQRAEGGGGEGCRGWKGEENEGVRWVSKVGEDGGGDSVQNVVLENSRTLHGLIARMF